MTYLQKYVFPVKKVKDAIAFNTIRNRNEVKTMVKNISYDCKGKLNSTTCNSSRK